MNPAGWVSMCPASCCPSNRRVSVELRVLLIVVFRCCPTLTHHVSGIGNCSQSCFAAGGQRQPLCLPAQRERNQGRSSIRALPQTIPRSAGQEPLSPLSDRGFSPAKQT